MRQENVQATIFEGSFLDHCLREAADWIKYHPGVDVWDVTVETTEDGYAVTVYSRRDEESE